ncbi:MAG: hypothetical protein ACRCU3_02175 [Eubacteriaceae bacterium]
MRYLIATAGSFNVIAFLKSVLIEKCFFYLVLEKTIPDKDTSSFDGDRRKNQRVKK